jgi:hypothetical protein
MPGNAPGLLRAVRRGLVDGGPPTHRARLEHPEPGDASPPPPPAGRTCAPNRPRLPGYLGGLPGRAGQRWRLDELGKGECLDNAVPESFFEALEAELIEGRTGRMPGLCRQSSSGSRSCGLAGHVGVTSVDTRPFSRNVCEEGAYVEEPDLETRQRRWQL